jgi:hypothetical protein
MRKLRSPECNRLHGFLASYENGNKIVSDKKPWDNL